MGELVSDVVARAKERAEVGKEWEDER